MVAKKVAKRLPRGHSARLDFFSPLQIAEVYKSDVSCDDWANKLWRERWVSARRLGWVIRLLIQGNQAGRGRGGIWIEIISIQISFASLVRTARPHLIKFWLFIIESSSLSLLILQTNDVEISIKRRRHVRRDFRLLANFEAENKQSANWKIIFSQAFRSFVASWKPEKFGYRL